jgi:hypothetical protein
MFRVCSDGVAGVHWPPILAAWARCHVTDVDAFAMLCRACPRVVQLMATHPHAATRSSLCRNLLTLLQRRRGTDIARLCATLRPPTADLGDDAVQALLDDPCAVGFAAAWKLFRFAPLAEVDAEVDALQRGSGGNAQRLHDTACMLLWVSRHCGAGAMETADGSDTRRQLLVRMLVTVSTALYTRSLRIGEDGAAAGTRLALLWTGVFSPLLRDGLLELRGRDGEGERKAEAGAEAVLSRGDGQEGERDALQPPHPLAIVLALARRRVLPHPTWPAAAVTLCRLLSGHADVGEVCRLFFRRSGSVYTVDSDTVAQLVDEHGALPPDVSNALVSLPSLPSYAQDALLRCTLPVTVTLDGAAAVAAAARLDAAVRRVPAPQGLQLPPSRFADALVARHAAVHARVRLVPGDAAMAAVPPPRCHPGLHWLVVLLHSETVGARTAASPLSRVAWAGMRRFMEAAPEHRCRDTVTLVASGAAVERHRSFPEAIKLDVAEEAKAADVKGAIDVIARELGVCSELSVCTACRAPWSHQCPVLVLVCLRRVDPDQVGQSLAAFLDSNARAAVRLLVVALHCSPEAAGRLRHVVDGVRHRAVRVHFEDVKDAADMERALLSIARP